LILKLRDASKKDMDLMLFRIDFWQDKMKVGIVSDYIP